MEHSPRRYFADQYEGNADPDLELYAHYGHLLYAHKATEGVHHIDAKHAQRTRAAHSHNLAVLHYHFARPDSTAGSEAEAEMFWRAVKPVWRPGDRLALDCEPPASGTWGGVQAYVPKLSAAVARVSGVYPWIYGSTSFLTARVPAAFLRNNPRWEAAYGPKPGKGPWGKAWIAWQFTDGQVGPVPHRAAGIGECDISMLNLRETFVLRRQALARKRSQQKGR